MKLSKLQIIGLVALMNQRKELDTAWAEALIEAGLDPKKDYDITPDGIILPRHRNESSEVKG